MRFLAEAAPGTHPLVPVCGRGDEYFNLVALKFYYCAFTPDTLANTAVAVTVTIAFAFFITGQLRPGVPSKLQMVLEFLLGYARQLVRDTVAEDAGFIIPIAATIGLYILIANWIDFLPITGIRLRPANSDLNQTAAMAIFVILVVQWYSARVLGWAGYLRRFTKPFELPVWARALMVPLNIIEEVVKPITLSLRLFGNIFAGVLMVYLIGLLFSAGIEGAGLMKIFGPLGVLFLAVWKAFDVFFVGSIQAFIFMLLTIIYFGMAREGLEGEHGPGGRHEVASQPGQVQSATASPATSQ